MQPLVKCTCVLHNYLRSHQTYEQEIQELPNEDFHEPDDQFIGLERIRSRAARAAYDIQDKFKHYFTTEDILP